MAQGALLCPSSYNVLWRIHDFATLKRKDNSYSELHPGLKKREAGEKDPAHLSILGGSGHDGNVCSLSQKWLRNFLWPRCQAAKPGLSPNRMAACKTCIAVEGS